MPARHWKDLTVEELQHALQETSTALLPLGVVEQHGFHLPLDTDIRNAQVLCDRASAQTGCLVLPTLHYAFSGGELTGTINLNPHLYACLLMEIIRETFRNGVRSLVLVHGHGGSDHCGAVRGAAEMFLRLHPHYADRNVAVYSFWEHSPTFAQGGQVGDFHAGWLETSLMLACAPEVVRRDRVVLDEEDFAELMRSDQDAYEVREKRVDHPDVVPWRHQSPRMQVGVMGYPERANAADGEASFAEGTAGLVELIRALEADR